MLYYKYNNTLCITQVIVKKQKAIGNHNSKTRRFNVGFREEILKLAADVPNQIERLQTEEATKHAFVLPLLKALGYNVFDSNEVIPEFVADVGVKRREKVDYAIKKDDQVIMIVECKACTVQLGKKQISQLARYFTWTDATVGVLTNGVTYQFYADLINPNKLDPTPFFEFSMLNIKPGHITELEGFKKDAFNPEEILNHAMDLVYKKQIQQVMLNELTSPSDDLVKFFLSRIYEGRKTKTAVLKFTPIVKQALADLFADQKRQDLKTILADASSSRHKKDKTQIVTTEEELEGYRIVRAIIGQITDAQRVAIRDTASYCGILLDDNNRKAICRLHFNRTQKYLGLFDEQKKETRVAIDEVADIENYAPQLKARVSFLDTGQVSDDLRLSVTDSSEQKLKSATNQRPVSLTKGQNISFAQVAPDVSRIAVELGWDARATTGEEIDIDASAFLLGDNGNVLSDHHFLFFNNLTSPDGSIQHLGNHLPRKAETDYEVIHIDLDQVPAEIKKVTFSVTIYEAETRSQNFGMVNKAFIRVSNRDNEQELVRYHLGQDLTSETALIFGEIYRYNEQWKFKAVGQGFAGGLGIMAQNFGVKV